MRNKLQIKPVSTSISLRSEDKHINNLFTAEEMSCKAPCVCVCRQCVCRSCGRLCRPDISSEKIGVLFQEVVSNC